VSANPGIVPHPGVDQPGGYGAYVVGAAVWTGKLDADGLS
jgi:hypothetical protein